jgi:hypothetical protein
VVIPAVLKVDIACGLVLWWLAFEIHGSYSFLIRLQTNWSFSLRQFRQLKTPHKS